jgi:dipeptidase E
VTTGRHVVALGGGGFSDHGPGDPIDDYILSLTGAVRPRVLFVPTASGDAAGYVERFHDAFAPVAETRHLSLFRREVADLDDVLLDADVVYVGGGSTANLLAIWRLHGLDVAVIRAHARGAVLCGPSAGALCWFSGGITDSFGPGRRVLGDGLGLLEGRFCPHYDSEPWRAAEVADLAVAAGPVYACDDDAALPFVDGSLHRAVSSRPGATAYLVQAEGGAPTATALPVHALR